MTPCLFVSDLHGKLARYEKFFAQISECKPAAVFIGGDLTPHHNKPHLEYPNFIIDYIGNKLSQLKSVLGSDYPNIYVIPGNDDPASDIDSFKKLDYLGLWYFAHFQKHKFGDFEVVGYSFVPPTPFLLKDWERFDVSAYAEPGCIPPTEGIRTIEKDTEEDCCITINDDLSELAMNSDMKRTIFLFHTPPYDTCLDRAALDKKQINNQNVDVHVGSIAVRRFITNMQPLVTLHGHIHESARITGKWKEILGDTVMMTAAHDGPELALVRFDAENPADAVRELIV